MSRDAGRELARALLTRAGGDTTIVAHRTVDWGALLFEGHRHELRLALPAAAAAAFAAGIGEAEFALPGHVVADVVVIGREEAGEIATLEVEALTLVDR